MFMKHGTFSLCLFPSIPHQVYFSSLPLKSGLRDGIAEIDPYNCYSIYHKSDNQMLQNKTYLKWVSIEEPNLDYI